MEININSLEEIKFFTGKNNNIIFTCEKCGKQTKKRLEALRKNRQLLCKSCLTRQTCLEKYGVINVKTNLFRKIWSYKCFSK